LTEAEQRAAGATHDVQLKRRNMRRHQQPYPDMEGFTDARPQSLSQRDSPTP
jgi:hypothetical protein